MWQLGALGSLLVSASGDVADKAAFVYGRAVDFYVATFWRQFLFLFLSCIVGYFGWSGELKLFFGWQTIAYGLVSLPASYFYTTLLIDIEVTSIVAFTCLSPILFLAIDVLFLGVGLTLTQQVAIIILALGGFAFAVDGKTHKVKKELSLLILCILAYTMFHDAAEFYLFKYVNTHYAVNGVSFFVSSYSIVTVCTFAVVVMAGKARLMLKPASLRYMRIASTGKTLDTVGALLQTYALSFAAVSQVTAVMALRPFVVFLMALFTQKEMRVRLRERLDKGNVHWKVGAVGLLVLGTFLVG